MRCAAGELVDDDADVLGAAGHVDARDGLHGAGVGVLVQHVRHVVRLVGVADALVIRAPLEDLLETAVQVSHHGNALDDLLAGEAQDQPEYAVRRWMLRTHVEDELFGLDPLVGDDGKIDLSAFLGRRTHLGPSAIGVGAQVIRLA